MPDQQIIEAGGFVHCVFFWLKEPENRQAREEFEHHLKTFLETSRYVKAKHIGTMVSSERGVVDNTYTYCLIATFKNREEQDKYQEEPVHLKFIEDARTYLIIVDGLHKAAKSSSQGARSVVWWFQMSDEQRWIGLLAALPEG